MSTYADQKKRYIVLHRVMSGLTLFCVMVFMIGKYVIARASAESVAWQAFLLACAGYAAGFVIIKIWASWEDIQQGSHAHASTEE